MGVAQPNLVSKETRDDDMNEANEAGFLDKELKSLKDIVRTSLLRALDQAHAEVAKYLRKNGEHITRFEKKVEGKVEQNPMMALVVAGGIGLLIKSFLNKKQGSGQHE